MALLTTIYQEYDKDPAALTCEHPMPILSLKPKSNHSKGHDSEGQGMEDEYSWSSGLWAVRTPKTVSGDSFKLDGEIPETYRSPQYMPKIGSAMPWCLFKVNTEVTWSWGALRVPSSAFRIDSISTLKQVSGLEPGRVSVRDEGNEA